MKYTVDYTNRFKKDLKLAQKQGKNIDELFRIVDLLSKDIPLEEKNADHPLIGEYSGFRECHIQPDWLLIYKKYESTLILLLSRVGSHSDLF